MRSASEDENARRSQDQSLRGQTAHRQQDKNGAHRALLAARTSMETHRATEEERIAKAVWQHEAVIASLRASLADRDKTIAELMRSRSWRITTHQPGGYSRAFHWPAEPSRACDNRETSIVVCRCPPQRSSQCAVPSCGPEVFSPMQGQEVDERVAVHDIAGVNPLGGASVRGSLWAAWRNGRPRYAPRELARMAHELRRAFALEFPSIHQVSVVIPVFNQIDHTMQCLLSLAPVQLEAAFEVILVDDNSSDETSQLPAGHSRHSLLAQRAQSGVSAFLQSRQRGRREGTTSHCSITTRRSTKAGSESYSAHFGSTRDSGLVGSKLVFPTERSRRPAALSGRTAVQPISDGDCLLTIPRSHTCERRITAQLQASCFPGHRAGRR